MDVHQQHFHKQPFAVDTRRAHKSSPRDTDVKVCEALVTAPRRTVWQVCIRTSACSRKDTHHLFIFYHVAVGLQAKEQTRLASVGDWYTASWEINHA
ncbi:hypothetical protein R3I94_011297 [Phoxinus phoxinus]